MRILIGVDQSPHSERAVRFVTRMRWPAGSRVIVASVMTPPRDIPNTGRFSILKDPQGAMFAVFKFAGA